MLYSVHLPVPKSYKELERHIIWQLSFYPDYSGKLSDFIIIRDNVRLNFYAMVNLPEGQLSVPIITDFHISYLNSWSISDQKKFKTLTETILNLYGTSKKGEKPTNETYFTVINY